MNKQLLIKLRKTKKLNQEEMAKFLNVSSVTYRNYESGRTEPPFKTLKLICDILETTPNTLLEYDKPISDKEILKKALEICSDML